MKIETIRNRGLAMVGLAALTIYILACTSFSPDDKQVLYPSVDPQSGAPGVAIYDRPTARSHMVFVPLTYGETNFTGVPLLRPQWLGNGRRVLVSWAEGKDSDGDGLQLAVIPVTGEGAVRLFRLPLLTEAPPTLMMPLAVAGQNVFLQGSNAVLRLNLGSGALSRHELPEEESKLYVYPGFDDGTLFYLLEKRDNGFTFGRFNPETFARTPSITFTNALADGSFFTYDDRGRRIAFVEDTDKGQQLVVLESGKPAFARPVFREEKLKFGSAVFMTRQNLVLASFMRRQTDKTSSFGLLEIPLNGGAVRETALIRDAAITDDEAALYFQVGVSHDGKTAAISSMYLGCEADKFNPSDCALFFVDLGDAKRQVNKVQITMPARPAGR